MAVIQYGSIVVSGSGSLGGSTLQHGHSGPIWRNKPQTLKKRSPAQSIIRGYNKTMQAGWRSLSNQDRQIWHDYAKIKPVFNRSGEKHPLSSHSIWMKYQFDALQKGAPFMTNPSEYPGPYYGPELCSDPFFANPALWSTSAVWVIVPGQASRPAGVVGNFWQTVNPVILNMSAFYQITVFFTALSDNCGYYIDVLEKRAMSGIGEQSVIDNPNSTASYFGGRSAGFVEQSMFSVKRIYQ